MSAAGKINSPKNPSTSKGADIVLKLVIIGDGEVGKSSMLLRFAENRFTGSYVETIGVDFKIKYMNVDDKKVKVEIWDTAGQERWLGITTRMYRNAHGFILAYDLTNKTSFQHVRAWMDEIREHGIERVPVCLVGNKNDLENERKVSAAEGQRLATNFLVPFCETSAKTGENIEQIFEQLIHSIIGDSGDIVPIPRRSSIIQPSEKDEPRKNTESQCQC